MEEPVHYLMMLIYTDGMYIQKLAEVFTEPTTLMQCLDYGDEYRESVATYVFEKDGINVNRWIMNDGSGDWFGYSCYQDPDRMKNEWIRKKF